MTESDMLQSDLRELLRVLDMPDHARSQAPHEVFQEALTVLRERAPYLLPRLTSVARCSQDNAATLYFDGPLSDDQLTAVHEKIRAVIPSAAFAPLPEIYLHLTAEQMHGVIGGEAWIELTAEQRAVLKPANARANPAQS